MSTFFSADICLARVLGKRARARTCQMLGAVDIDRKEMAASSTGISVGAWTKREVQELETSKWRERGMMMAWEWARGGGGWYCHIHVWAIWVGAAVRQKT